MLFYAEIYVWKCKKFSLGIHHSLADAVDINLGWITIVYFYKPEEQ